MVNQINCAVIFVKRLLLILNHLTFQLPIQIVAELMAITYQMLIFVFFLCEYVNIQYLYLEPKKKIYVSVNQN